MTDINTRFCAKILILSFFYSKSIVDLDFIQFYT